MIPAYIIPAYNDAFHLGAVSGNAIPAYLLIVTRRNAAYASQPHRRRGESSTKQSRVTIGNSGLAVSQLQFQPRPSLERFFLRSIHAHLRLLNCLHPHRPERICAGTIDVIRALALPLSANNLRFNTGGF